MPQKRIYYTTGSRGSTRYRRHTTQSLTNVINQAITRKNETHYKITEFAAVKPLNSSVYSAELTDIAQGTGQDQRLGDAIYTRSVLAKVQISANVNGNDYQTVRCVLYTPKKADLLLNTAGPGNLTTLSHIDPSLYTVWFDKIISVGKGASSSMPNRKHFTLSHKFHNNVRPGMKTQYADNSTTDCQKNSLNFVMVSASTANGPEMHGYVQTYFKDA